MKKYRYRKVNPKMESKMRRLRERGITYKELAKILGVNSNTIRYHLNPKEKARRIESATKAYSKLSNKEKAIQQKKRVKYKSDYYMDRYHHDPEFRKRVISQIVRWQRKKRAEKYDNKKN